MIRTGRVINVNYAANTVDIAFDSGGGIVRQVNMVGSIGATLAGCWEPPLLSVSPKAPQYAVEGANQKIAALDVGDARTLGTDTPTDNSVWAVVAQTHQEFSRTGWVCLGFYIPFRSQMLFDFDSIDKSSLPQYIKDAIKKLKGGLMHRTNSSVYWTVDRDGNMEWCHPNGTFFRIAESPTQDEDGAYHVDLSGGNNAASLPNLAWDTSKVKGSDDNPNSARKLYAHMEVVTEKGTVEIDINKKTGNITIRTPKDTSNTSQSVNQLTIIAGGDATIQSVEGDVIVQSVKKHIDVHAGQDMRLKTDSAANSSILIGENGANGHDFLVLFEKLKAKFNEHTHTCKGTNKQTAKPDKQLDQKDATFVTQAG